MDADLQHLMPDSRERMSNFVHNAAEVLGITPAAVSQIVQASPTLVDLAANYDQPRKTPIYPPPAVDEAKPASEVNDVANPAPKKKGK